MQTISRTHEIEQQARTLLASNPDKLVQRFILIHTLFDEEQEARSSAEQDSQQVREENGELLEELATKTTYITELEQKLTSTTIAAIGMVHELAEEPATCTHCQELEQVLEQTRQMLAMEQRRYEDLDARHTALCTKWEDRQKWREQLVANGTIPNANCKLVATYLWENGLEYTDSRKKFVKEQIAADLGCDPGTVANAITRLKDYDVINVDTEDLKLPDGTIHKNAITYISRGTLTAPTSIRMEKKQGAAKPKICFRDGITLMNAYTVRHCPAHGEIGLYDQPCTPKGTDETLMIDDFIRKYQNRIPRALAIQRDSVTGQLISITSISDETPTSEEKKPSSTASTAIVDSTATIVDAQPDTMPSNNTTSINDRKHTSEEKKPSSTASTASTDAQPDTTPLDNTTSTNDETRKSEEKKPSSTAIAPTTNEDDRWAAAEKILADLNTYGLTLEYQEDGSRHLLAPATSTAPLSALKKQIKRYDLEIRGLLAMQATYDPLVAAQMLNTTLPDDQQITLEHTKVNAQRIPPPSTESFLEKPTIGLGVQCDICHYNEAIVIWKAGKRYCQACHEKEASL